MARVCVVGAASLVLLCFATATAPAFSTFGKAFCEPAAVGALQRAFDRLPPVRQPPQDAPLPFGPDFLSLYGGGSGRLQLEPGRFSYGFFDERAWSDRTPVTLGWDVTTTLTRIGKRGNPVRVVSKRHRFLGTVTDFEEVGFSVRVPGARSFYRFEIEFVERTSGRRLGAFASYLRVVKKSYHAGLAINRRAVRPRQPIFARVENRGSVPIEFGAPYAVQRWTSGGWVGAPGFDVEAWPAIEYWMSGGQSGNCVRYRPPASAQPGRYRFVRHLGWWRRAGKEAVAIFRVTR